MDKARRERFPQWLYTRAHDDPQCDPLIRRLTLKPKREALSYYGCDVNGFRFHTESHAKHRTTNNSGVWLKGETEGNITHDFYSVLDNVVELEYPGVHNKVVLFKCRWFDITNGVKVDRAHGLVEVKHTTTLRTGEPHIIASQASQVHFSLLLLSGLQVKRVLQLPYLLNCFSINTSEMLSSSIDQPHF